MTYSGAKPKKQPDVPLRPARDTFMYSMTQPARIRIEEFGEHRSYLTAYCGARVREMEQYRLAGSDEMMNFWTQSIAAEEILLRIIYPYLQGKTVTVQDIVTSKTCSPETARRILSDAREFRFIYVERDPEDRRRRLIRPTVGLVHAFEHHHVAHFRHMLSLLPEGDSMRPALAAWIAKFDRVQEIFNFARDEMQANGTINEAELPRDIDENQRWIDEQNRMSEIEANSGIPADPDVLN